MTFNGLTVGSLAAAIFSLVALVPNNLVRLTSVALRPGKDPCRGGGLATCGKSLSEPRHRQGCLRRLRGPPRRS